MTLTVHHAGYPDRLACPSCMCEVTAINKPGYVAYATGDQYTPEGAIGWYLRPLDVDEPPVYLIDDCTCRCHQSARQFLANVYDPA